MPCRSEHMEPTAKEGASQLVARLLIFVATQLNRTFIPNPVIVHAAENVYGNAGQLDAWTAKLCYMLENMTPEQENIIIYNGRDGRSRELADWWEKHQAWDRKRKAEEASKFKVGDKVKFTVEATISEVYDGQQYKLDGCYSDRYRIKFEHELEGG